MSLWSPTPQLLQHLKRIISDLCKLYNLPQHPDVEMLDQPLPADQVRPRAVTHRQHSGSGGRSAAVPLHPTHSTHTRVL